MTHWRKQHDHGVAELKRLDARFDRAMRMITIGLLGLTVVLWGIALS